MRGARERCLRRSDSLGALLSVREGVLGDLEPEREGCLWSKRGVEAAENARLAQLDRALASGAKGRRFESCIARHCERGIGS